MTFHLQVGQPLQSTATDQQRREAATEHLAALPQRATWVRTDRSVEAGVLNGGAGAFMDRSDGEEHELRRTAGRICSCFRAEMIALRKALQFLLDNPAHTEDHVVVCTDSQSALASLQGGPSVQTSQLGTDIWRALRELARDDRQIILQWVPSHCGLGGNERVDSIAKEASLLNQEDTATIDVQTAHRAAARLARSCTTQALPAGWYRFLMGQRLPPLCPRGSGRPPSTFISFGADTSPARRSGVTESRRTPLGSASSALTRTADPPSAWCAARRRTHHTTFF